MVRRQALTAVELLVAVGVMAALGGLLLTAVQKARAAASRTQCQANLSQVGRALHAFHDRYACLPKGVTRATKAEPLPRTTWLARLLPDIGQEPLWHMTIDAYRFQRVPYLQPHVGLGQPVKLYSCPADSRTAGPQTTHRGLVVALTSYVGVSGLCYSDTTGVLYADSRTRISDIADGASGTAVVGERPPSADFWYGWWYAGYGQKGTGSADMLLGVIERNARGAYVSRCDPGPGRFGPGSATEQCDLFHYWSPHPGGAHFLFADGSVRFLPYSAAGALPAMATRSGGEPAAAE